MNKNDLLSELLAETEDNEIDQNQESASQTSPDSVSDSSATNPKQADPAPTKSNSSPITEEAPSQPSARLIRRSLPLIPLKDGVIFPNTEAVLTFARPTSIKAIDLASKTDNLAVVVAQTDPNLDNPNPNQLYRIGTLVKIDKTFHVDGAVNALVKAQKRVIIDAYLRLRPVMVVGVTELTEALNRDEELKIIISQIQENFKELIQVGKPVEFVNFMKLLSGLKENELLDQIANTLNIETAEKQKILEELDIKKRAELILTKIAEERKILDIEKEVINKTQANFDKNAKESILRERLRIIQKELGEIDDEEELADEYTQKLEKLKVSDEIKAKINKETKRFRQSSVHNPENGYIRNWLDEVFDLPWGKHSKDVLDIKKAEKILDDSHYGLKEVKDRVLEYIAVRQLRGKNKIKDQTKPTILCFVGPPGVGKTSIGKSIASAMGRKFTKISLGGIRDEAEIRGHRRTYVGAMPGRIIAGMKRAEKMNPVFMLDELDKIGADYKGDPAAALLEVLDPEQNFNFEDHYLDMPFDLSQVTFIATANTTDIPPALRDRMEIIEYSGYTVNEKMEIAKQHLWHKVLKANNLKPTQITLSDKMLRAIVENYTKEAGVRSLERQLLKLTRKVARQIVSNDFKKVEIKDETTLVKYLGPKIFDVSLTEEKDEVGIVTGLAWTSVGGDILFIEAALTEGADGKGGQIKLTGQLGDVMKESAQAAYTYVQSHAPQIGIKAGQMDKMNLHLHVPEGAVPKDGPSAGVTMATAIASAFSGKKVRREVAMTGEITLRGKVLRIGGLKEKAIAAHRAGCTTIIIPADNLRDLDEMPTEVKKDITFKPVQTIEEVFKIALI